MSSQGWNYRIVHRVHRVVWPDGRTYDEDIYQIHEVYYSAQACPNTVSVEACYPHGASLDDFTKDMAMYQQAMERPVLEWADIVPSEPVMYHYPGALASGHPKKGEHND